jgi:hypothetical protein
MSVTSSVAARHCVALARSQQARLFPGLALQLAVRRPFTTRYALLSERKTTTTTATTEPPKPKQAIHQNPELPKFSLDGLGLSKNMKTLFYVLICIWGTFETYFYGQAIYTWWTAKPAEGN